MGWHAASSLRDAPKSDAPTVALCAVRYIASPAASVAAKITDLNTSRH
jgi:hypothetical protein